MSRPSSLLEARVVINNESGVGILDHRVRTFAHSLFPLTFSFFLSLSLSLSLSLLQFRTRLFLFPSYFVVSLSNVRDFSVSFLFFFFFFSCSGTATRHGVEGKDGTLSKNRIRALRSKTKNDERKEKKEKL